MLTKLRFSRTNEDGYNICSECGQPIYPEDLGVNIWGNEVHQSCADYLDASIEEEMLRRAER
jgi:hypothetical protein